MGERRPHKGTPGTFERSDDWIVDSDQTTLDLQPQTIDRCSERALMFVRWQKGKIVAFMPDGFAWNGERFDSLSEIAFAVTGTKSNGPRFFGLRDRRPRSMPRSRNEVSDRSWQ